MIKFNLSLDNFEYLLMFDLASKTSGVCLWEIKTHKPVLITHFTVQAKDKVQHSLELWKQLTILFDTIKNKNIDLSTIFVSKEAMPQQLHGRGSTVQTLLALARTHGVLDLFLAKNNIAYYDDTGVYPISTHAHLKHLYNWDSKHTVDKDDIRYYVESTYNLSGITYDESDAIFLAQTLIDSKWDKDIQEQIRMNNRHIKTLKEEHAIQLWHEKNNYLNKLKN